MPPNTTRRRETCDGRVRADLHPGGRHGPAGPVGVPARPLPARQPGPDTAGPPLPPPAPRQGLRHDHRTAPALGPPRCAAPLAADPPVPAAVAAGARSEE